MVSRDGNLTSRPGYQCIATTSGGVGLAKYVKISATTGRQLVEKLVLGSQLYKINTGSFTITYTPGSLVAIDASVLIDPDDGDWHFYLNGDGTELLDFNLGKGFDEASPVTLNDLDTAISAVSGFAAVPTSGTTSIPAAFLDSIISQPFSSNQLVLTYSYMTLVNQPASAANPFASTYANRNQDYFELATHVNARNCIYFGTANDEQQKYDGQKVYRSGVPAAPTPTANVVVAGSGRSGANIRYKIQFWQVDAQGNRQPGLISEATAQVSPTADTVEISFSPISASSGFNTDAAMVVGAQATVNTVNVDNGAGGAHTLKVGDVAYLYDAVSASFVARNITAAAAGTITIDGAAVTVADNAPISANLRVALYTQAVEDGAYYLVNEYPHNSWVGTQTIQDTGVALGAQFFDPIPGSEPGLPPKGKYLAIFKGLMWVVGMLDDPNGYAHSDFESPESFPPDSNRGEIVTQEQDRFTGAYPTKEHLMLFKERSSHLVIGDFDDSGFFRFRIDDLSLSAGVGSHHTIKQLSDGSIRAANSKGIYRFSGMEDPVEVSGAILPIFNDSDDIASNRFSYSRAVSFYIENKEQYVIFIPKESLNGSDRYANRNSKLFYLDTQAGEFFEWANMNMEGGAIVDGDDVYWVERRLSSFSSTVVYNLYKRLRMEGDYSQTDNGTPIEFSYFTGWDHRGSPSALKKPTRVRVTATSSTRSPFFTLTLEQYRDYEAGRIASRIAMSFGTGSGSGYGISPYGTAPYGDPGAARLTRKLKSPRKCEAWAYRLYHQKNYETPIISFVETEFAAPYALATKQGVGEATSVPSAQSGNFDPFS